MENNMRFDMSMSVDNIMPLAVVEEQVDRCFSAMEEYFDYNGALGIRIFEDYLEEYDIDIDSLPNYLADKLYSFL